MKHELSEMLAAGKENAPPPRYTVEDVLDAGRKQQSRRRALFTGVGSAAAVVAVAAAIAVPQIVTRNSPGLTTENTAPAASAAKPVAYTYPTGTFAGNLAPFKSGELSVSGTIQVTPAYQVATIVAPGKGTPLQDADGQIHESANDVGDLVVYRQGAFSAAVLKKTGEQVKVGKNAGLYVAAQKQSTSAADVKKIGGARYSDATLAWQYADDSWAVVTTAGASKVTEADMINLAQNVTSVTSAVPTVDFKVGAVPAGFQLGGAGTSDTSFLGPLEGESFLRLVKGSTDYRGLTGPILDALIAGNKQQPTLSLTVYPSWYSKHVSSTGTCLTGQSLCYKSTKDGKFVVELNGGGFLSDSQLTKVIKSVTFADPTDTSTWFKATSAVS